MPDDVMDGFLEEEKDMSMEVERGGCFRRGIGLTAPYFHDNSAKTLEDVAAHYAKFFSFVTNGFIVLTPQDQQDIVAFMKLLD